MFSCAGFKNDLVVIRFIFGCVFRSVQLNLIYYYMLFICFSDTLLLSGIFWNRSFFYSFPFFKLQILVFSNWIFMELSHRRTHLWDFFGGKTGHKTARIASSKTVFNPFWVSAEHSKYFTELISFAIARPLKEKEQNLRVYTAYLGKTLKLSHNSKVKLFYIRTKIFLYQINRNVLSWV